MISGWFVLELFGHVTHVGEVSEIEIFGGKMGRIVTLERDGSREERLFGHGAVYGLRPITEAAARERMRPYTPYVPSLPASYPDDYFPHGDPDGETVDASFKPRTTQTAHFDATTDERGDLIEPALERGGTYEIEVFVGEDLTEPWNGGRATVAEDGRLEIGEFLDLQPGTKYRFTATKLGGQG